MNFEQIPQQEKKSLGLMQAELLAQEIFNYSEDPKQRYDKIINRIKVFLREDEKNPLAIDVIRQINEDIRECCKIQDIDEFTNSFVRAVSPVLELEKNNIKQFESLVGRNTLELFDFIKINDLLYYGKNGNVIHIHVPPATSLSLTEKSSYLNDGLKDLADIIDQDKEIEVITATSALVAKHPDFLTKIMGFVIDGPISDDVRQKYFKNDTSEISEAHMTREDFLNKYKINK